MTSGLSRGSRETGKIRPEKGWIIARREKLSVRRPFEWWLKRNDGPENRTGTTTRPSDRYVSSSVWRLASATHSTPERRHMSAQMR